MLPRVLLRALVLVAHGAIVLSSCSKEEFKAVAGEGAECSINSNCPTPLVCAFQRCHAACDETRDCPEGQRCMVGDSPSHVCQLPDETKCSYNSECPLGQTCGLDGECRDPCVTDRDCVPGQLCSDRACVELTEDSDAGHATLADSGATATGERCSFASDCPSPLVCREGNCRFECIASADCRPNYDCSANRCVPPICGGEQTPVAALGGGVCTFSSECPSPLVCRRGFCNCECLGDRDCGPDGACTTHRCVASALGGAGDAGAGRP